MYNTAAAVLGVLAARAAGQTFGDVLRTRIFEPLGMSQTAFWTGEIGRLATAYRRAYDPAALDSTVLDSTVLMPARVAASRSGIRRRVPTAIRLRSRTARAA